MEGVCAKNKLGIKMTPVSQFVQTKHRMYNVTAHIVWKLQKKVVSFKIASEASYIYILSGQKLVKMPKVFNFDDFLKT